MLIRTHVNRSLFRRDTMLLTLVAILIFASTRMQADTGTCNGQSLTLPFTDVPGTNVFFCSIAQAFFTGLTNGTSPTTYSPAANVTREQMAAFITRTQDSALKRGSRRAAAGQWWTPRDVGFLNTTVVGSEPKYGCFDGEDIWVPNLVSGTVTRVHASDGRILGTWTGVDRAHSTIAAAGYIYVLAQNPGRIYRINPIQAPTAATLIENGAALNNVPKSITCDGSNLWTANVGVGGSITRYNIGTGAATAFSAGFDLPAGIVFDGTHLWVVDSGPDVLHRVNPGDGTILETVPLGAPCPPTAIPIFDGSNIWVPVNFDLKVVSTSGPARLLATLSGNGLGNNLAVAFDGERIMVTNFTGTVSLWKASSLTPLGFLDLGDGITPTGGVCSDGLNFWISVRTDGSDFLMRF